jgi:hypothetical protein
MPLFVGSVGYFADAVAEGAEGAPLPPPPTLPLRACRACRGGAAAAVGDTTFDAGADVGAGFSRQLAGAGARVGRCPV